MASLPIACSRCRCRCHSRSTPTRRNAVRSSIAWWPVFGRSRAWKARRLVQRCRSRALATRSRFTIEGRPEVPGEIRDALFRVGTPGYLKTLGVAAAEGRLIDERDGAGAPRAAVVNQTMARQFLPNQSAIGHRIRFDTDGPWFTIVGVVRRRARTWIRAGRQARGVRVITTGWRQPCKPSRPSVGRSAGLCCCGAAGDPGCRSGSAGSTDQIDVGCRVADGCRSPATHDAARRVWRARDAHRVHRSVRPARAIRVGPEPRDRLTNRLGRNREERRDDGDVARDSTDNYRRGASVSSWPGCSRARCRRCCLA